ncbi:peptidyl-prolyl cis-trans isomerase [Lysobacter sp. A289]
MLQKLRDKTSGWIAMAIMGVLIVPFALFGLDQYMVQGGSSTVAVIKAPPAWWTSAPSFWPVSVLWRQEEITTNEFQDQFQRVRQQQRAAQGDAFDSRDFAETSNKLAVLDALVNQRVQTMAADASGIAISDAMVRNEIQQIPAFQVDGKFDPQRYQLALASQVPAQSPAQFDAMVRQSLKQSLLANAIAGSNFITNSEMARLVKLMGERRDVSLVVVPAPEASAADAAPTPAEIQAWYDAHAVDYIAPESVSVEYISLDRNAMPEPPPADEASLRQLYEEQQDKFAEPEQRLASHILLQVDEGADATAVEAQAGELAAKARAEGADFAALAEANSDDSGSKASGGDLGWIGKGMMPGAVEDALFALESGQVSEPVRSEFGWHVIKLREVKAGARESFEEVRDALALEQVTAERDRMFNDLSSRVVDAVLRSPGVLEPAAEAANLSVQQLGSFTELASEGLAANPALKRAAFSETLVQDGTVSDPIEIEPGHNVWLRVTGHQPEHARPLDEVRNDVVAALQANQAQQAAAKRAETLLARLDGGESLVALVAAEQLPEPQVIPGVPRGAPLIADGVSEAIFAVQAAAEGKVAGGYDVLDDNRIVLFTVDKVVAGSDDQFPPQQREIMRQQLSQVAGIEDMQALIKTLRQRMQVKVIEQNL